MKRRGKMKINEDILKAFLSLDKKYDRCEYDSACERIVTHEHGNQVVVTQLVGDSEQLRVLGPVLVGELNKLREAEKSS